jgi:hypothetical protein
MRERILALGIITASAGLAIAASAQERTSLAQADTAYTYPDGSAHPVTAWGDPDLQGMWPIMHLIATQLQRNPQYGERRLLTDEEYQRAQGTLERRDAAYYQQVGNSELGMGSWAESTVRSDAARLTSLIAYPENGRFPELTARGEALRPEFGSSWSRSAYDSPQDDFDTWDRCITRGMPSSMLPFNYNNGIQILQSPGYVVINLEMIHEARIVPIDGEPLDPAIKQWMGESRGHWEGSTLVVETTNYNGEVGMTNVGIPGSPQGDTPSTPNMKTIERFTRIGPDTVEYEMTIEDPEVLTDRWTVSYPMFRDPEYRFFEYACHEDNTAVRNFIETSRFERGLTSSGAPRQD